MALLKDPAVSLVYNFSQKQKVVATERVGGLPLVAISIEAAYGHVVARAGCGFIFPDRGFDGPEPDFMRWFLRRTHGVFDVVYGFHPCIPKKGPALAGPGETPAYHGCGC